MSDIWKSGSVKITATVVEIDGFHFNCNSRQGAVLAIDWAIERLLEERKKVEE